jgi:putative SOS response-associated peptidase YedK
MCGRFKAGFEFRDIKLRWQIFNYLDFTPHYNIAPTQTHPIIVKRAGGLEARPMRWGLVPYWAKDQAIGNKMINARVRDSGGKAGFLLRKGKPLPSLAAVPDRS